MKTTNCKLQKIYSTIILLIIAISLNAQVVNYQKLKVYTMNGKGFAFNEKGSPVGKVDVNGYIYDKNDKKVAHIDAYGNIIEDETETNYGKVDKNGNFLVVVNKKVTSWKCNPPENQGTELCLVKDKTGKIVCTVNKVFKQFGPGTLYYFMQKQKK